MLVLVRRIGETLNIGDDIRVTVLGIKGIQVRIGVEAPKDIPVHREEIYKRIQEERESRSLEVCRSSSVVASKERELLKKGGSHGPEKTRQSVGQKRQIIVS